MRDWRPPHEGEGRYRWRRLSLAHDVIGVGVIVVMIVLFAWWLL